MYEISVITHFSAAHRLVGYDGSCANVHGHNWEISIFIRGTELNDIGVLVDFREVKQLVNDSLAELDHGDLNALPAFADANPTSENIARHLHEKLSAELNEGNCTVHRVAVRETPRTEVSYWEGE